MGRFLTIPRQEAHQLIDTVIKVYPKFTKVFRYKAQILAIDSDLVPAIPSPMNFKNRAASKSLSPELDLLRSLRRTKTTISDLVLCNEFDMFVTFTFSHDRFDLIKSKNKMSLWLQSQQKQHDSFSYLIVPEFHKDKKAIHFHALLGGYKGQVSYSGVKQNNKKVFNITSYRSGFTNMTYIQDYEKVSSYIKKYISKDMPQFTGQKRYWCSRNLIRPIITMHSHYVVNPFIDLSPSNLIFENERLRIHKISNSIMLSNKVRGIHHG